MTPLPLLISGLLMGGSAPNVATNPPVQMTDTYASPLAVTGGYAYGTVIGEFAGLSLTGKTGGGS